jgi:hypothetical protein
MKMDYEETEGTIRSGVEDYTEAALSHRDALSAAFRRLRIRHTRNYTANCFWARVVMFGTDIANFTTAPTNFAIFLSDLLTGSRAVSLPGC